MLFVADASCSAAGLSLGIWTSNGAVKAGVSLNCSIVSIRSRRREPLMVYAQIGPWRPVPRAVEANELRRDADAVPAIGAALGDSCTPPHLPSWQPHG